MHNHPSGDPTPSRADVEMTQAIVALGGSALRQSEERVVFGMSRSGRATGPYN